MFLDSKFIFTFTKIIHGRDFLAPANLHTPNPKGRNIKHTKCQINTLQSFNLYNVHENVYTFREIDPSDHVIHFSPLHNLLNGTFTVYIINT